MTGSGWWMAWRSQFRRSLLLTRQSIEAKRDALACNWSTSDFMLPPPHCMPRISKIPTIPPKRLQLLQPLRRRRPLCLLPHKHIPRRPLQPHAQFPSTINVAARATQSPFSTGANTAAHSPGARTTHFIRWNRNRRKPAANNRSSVCICNGVSSSIRPNYTSRTTQCCHPDRSAAPFCGTEWRDHGTNVNRPPLSCLPIACRQKTRRSRSRAVF